LKTLQANKYTSRQLTLGASEVMDFLKSKSYRTEIPSIVCIFNRSDTICFCDKCKVQKWQKLLTCRRKHMKKVCSGLVPAHWQIVRRRRCPWCRWQTWVRRRCARHWPNSWHSCPFYNRTSRTLT